MVRHLWLTRFLCFDRNRHWLYHLNWSLIVLNEQSCSAVHFNWVSFFVSFRSGWEITLKFGMNIAQYVAISRNLLTLLIEAGRLASWIAWTFFGSGEIPLDENTKPKTSINSHRIHTCFYSESDQPQRISGKLLEGVIMISLCHAKYNNIITDIQRTWSQTNLREFLENCLKGLSWSACVMPNTITSSCSLMTFWNTCTLLAELVPKFNRAYCRSLLWVANVVIYRHSGANISWW